MPGHLSLTTKDLPEIKNWNVKGTYKIELTVEMVEQSAMDNYDMPLMPGQTKSSSNEIMGRFKILKAEVDNDADEADPKNASKKAFHEMVTKGHAGKPLY